MKSSEGKGKSFAYIANSVWDGFLAGLFHFLRQVLIVNRKFCAPKSFQTCNYQIYNFTNKIVGNFERRELTSFKWYKMFQQLLIKKKEHT